MVRSSLRIVWSLFVGCLLVCQGVARAETAYTFGVVPQFEARELASIWMPIISELSRRTGLKLTMKGSPRIPEFENSFAAGEFDFAYMNPYHAVIAKRKQGYIPLIRDETPLYGVLVVRKDSPYQSPRDLAGKTVSFPSPNALGASLLMRAELDNMFHVKVVPLYAQTHTSAYLNTMLGVSEASGGVMGSFNQQKPDIRDGLRVIHETRRAPSHPVLAHPRVPEAHRKLVQQAFLDMAETPEGAALLAKVPMKKAVRANAAEYLELASWKLEKYYVKSGD